MDAYNAYYSQEDPSSKGKEDCVINNVMHINSTGANINITTGGNCMNNFIFNHTAPINLNFYKDSDKKVTHNLDR
jgi:hypothetical protein